MPNPKSHIPNPKSGFTLIELMVVIVIIAILSISAAVIYSSTLKKSRNNRRQTDLETIRQSLTMYRADDGCYPDETTGIYGGVLDGYLESVPSEPAGDEYTYTTSGACGASSASSFTLTSTNYEDAPYSVNSL
jgi:general secretion pathway protein G